MDTIQIIIYIGIFVVSTLIGILVGIQVRKKIAEAKIGSAEDKANQIVDEAKRVYEARKKEALIEAKEEIHRNRQEFDNEIKSRRNEVQRQERRIQQKEETIERKISSLEKKEENVSNLRSKLDKDRSEIDKIRQEQLAKLEEISSFTVDQAKEYLLSSIRDDVSQDAAKMIREIQEKAKEEADDKAREIVGLAIQKCAADHVAETTVSVVPLPSDEMKGRIIGREGRNIRTLETLTGIDLIIDDTPEAVVISGFDPIRREVARMTLEKLIIDGRIHPARIEETVEKSKKEIEKEIKQVGEATTFETGVHGLHPELVKLIGRLKYRTSYGQNILKHSIEVCYIAGVMAGELGVDVNLAKRAGLLHDIGKAVDHEMEGSHVTIGADIAKKYKCNKDVIHAIMAHHGDVEAKTVVACLVQAADAVSAARPGARRETLDSYIKRLEKLEEVANSFNGVEKSFAIQAGREIRIMVKPEDVNDNGMQMIARDIVKKIEEELDYPGQIKVHVVRETRAIEYAK